MEPSDYGSRIVLKCINYVFKTFDEGKKESDEEKSVLASRQLFETRESGHCNCSFFFPKMISASQPPNWSSPLFPKTRRFLLSLKPEPLRLLSVDALSWLVPRDCSSAANSAFSCSLSHGEIHLTVRIDGHSVPISLVVLTPTTRGGLQLNLRPSGWPVSLRF